MKKNLQNAELPKELCNYFESVPPVTKEDLRQLALAAEALDNDPAFQADYLKGLFVEKMLEAMEERGENQNQLAQRWGKSRQYVSKLFHEDKRANFTIETMSELAHLLGRRFDLQVLRPNEVAHVVRCLPTGRQRARTRAASGKNGIQNGRTSQKQRQAG